MKNLVFFIGVIFLFVGLASLYLYSTELSWYSETRKFLLKGWNGKDAKPLLELNIKYLFSSVFCFGISASCVFYLWKNNYFKKNN